MVAGMQRERSGMRSRVSETGDEEPHCIVKVLGRCLRA